MRDGRVTSAMPAVLSLNRFVLQARIVERGILRYTPAGIPALNFTLKHEGQSTEDGVMRQVVLEIRAKAVGPSITNLVAALPADTDATFTGFLAAARQGRGVVFHVNTVDQL
jgi:primosomal replication protein N